MTSHFRITFVHLISKGTTSLWVEYNDGCAQGVASIAFCLWSYYLMISYFCRVVIYTGYAHIQLFCMLFFILFQLKCNSQLMSLSVGAKSKFQILLTKNLYWSHVDQGDILHISYNIFLHFGGVKYHCCMLLFISSLLNCN